MECLESPLQLVRLMNNRVAKRFILIGFCGLKTLIQSDLCVIIMKNKLNKKPSQC